MINGTASSWTAARIVLVISEKADAAGAQIAIQNKIRTEVSYLKILNEILTFMFLVWPTLLLIFYALTYYFSSVLRAASASVYTIPLCMCGASTFAFKFLQINYRYWK